MYKRKHNSNPNNIPIAGAFDFEAAFPSVIHDWIWLVLHHRKMPPDYIRVFQSLYKHAIATFEHNGDIHVLIRLLSGVLQGCPASAFLFNNAIDPFLASFDKALRSRHAGIVRACADDIGIVLKQLKHLKLVQPIFNDFKSHAGLALKPPKCVLVPLCVFSQEVHVQVCNWVAHHLPDFNVKPLAKLLVFFIGPQAGTKMWEGPLTKYKDRINDIKRGSASIALNCHTYNT